MFEHFQKCSLKTRLTVKFLFEQLKFSARVDFAVTRRNLLERRFIEVFRYLMYIFFVTWDKDDKLRDKTFFSVGCFDFLYFKPERVSNVEAKTRKKRANTCLALTERKS